MHKVISRISSCMNQGFSSAQPKATAAEVKPAMCHIRMGWFLLAIMTCPLTVHVPLAHAQAAVAIEQAFANSLTAMPTENLVVSGAFYVPVYSSVSMSQGKV